MASVGTIGKDGSTIWEMVKTRLDKRASVAEIAHKVNAVLRDNHITYAEARKLHVGDKIDLSALAPQHAPKPKQQPHSKVDHGHCGAEKPKEEADQSFFSARIQLPFFSFGFSLG